ncbi:hypothetical protein V6N12_059864 [Hibiscus sabdariffa]|uniref:Uncharacterized protein n=1 Tax=Hibiscus sabdariffa TaxID=183260 RepID=A0ABR2BEB1_9ROSI
MKGESEWVINDEGFDDGLGGLGLGSERGLEGATVGVAMGVELRVKADGGDMKKVEVSVARVQRKGLGSDEGDRSGWGSSMGGGMGNLGCSREWLKWVVMVMVHVQLAGELPGSIRNNGGKWGKLIGP